MMLAQGKYGRATPTNSGQELHFSETDKSVNCGSVETLYAWLQAVLRHPLQGIAY